MHTHYLPQLVFSYLHLVGNCRPTSVLCWSFAIVHGGVNVGFWRRGSARTINFQLATIWKILGDLCHILWRLFTIARPKYFRGQFVADYWQHITFIGRIRRETNTTTNTKTNMATKTIRTTNTNTLAQQLFKYFWCQLVVDHRHHITFNESSIGRIQRELIDKYKYRENANTIARQMPKYFWCQFVFIGNTSLSLAKYGGNWQTTL